MIKRLLTLLPLSALVFGAVCAPLTAHAISGSSWQAGRIIDDSIFTNRDSMSASDIQTFLNQKVGTTQANGTPGVCDTNGTKPSEVGGGTRAQYGAAHGSPTPFTCLKDYYEVPKTTPGPGLPASNYGGAPIPSGAISAAQIIFNAAQTYSISPKVILTVLQKESAGPLVTDDWPFKSQYTYAMGAHCPDSSGCDSNYAGFSLQIYESAALFRYYLDNMTQPWWPYKKVGNNTILYNPSTNCGSSNVTVMSSATAALYTYTPYQPNAAALANMYGSGDSCSAYGNRNFWRMYNDWFGPSTSLLGGVTMTNITQPDPSPARGEVVSYVYSLTNTLPVAVTLDAVGVVGRAGSITGPNRDFGWQGPITLAANTTQQFTFTQTIHDTGALYVWPAVLYQGSYVHYNNWGELLNAHNPNLTVTTPLTSTLTSPVATQTTTLSATIKNNEPQPIQLDTIGIPVRLYDKYNYDTAWAGSSATLAAGASQTISGDVVLDKAGPYNAWLSALIGGQYVTLSPTVNFTAAPANPNFQLTYTEGPDPTPALGEDIVVKFKLKNNSGIPMTLDAIGVVGRYDNPYTGSNHDLGWVGPQTFTAGEEKSYTTFVSNISELRNFYAWPAIRYQGGYIHYNNWGFMMTPHVPNLTLSAPLTVNSGTQPALHASVPVTATVKNNEPYPIKFSALGIPARYYGTYNYDALWQGAGTLAASGQTGDSIALSGTDTFDKTGPYSLWTSINIQGRYITIGDQKNINM